MKKQPLKICYIPTLNQGVTYWRVESFAQCMLTEKFKGVCVPYVNYIFPPEENLSWEHLIFNRHYGEDIQTNLVEAFNYFDVIIFQKMQYKNGLSFIKDLMEKYPNKLVLVDIDDSISDIQPSNFNIHKMKDEHSWAAYQVETFDGVIASTEYLKKQAIKFREQDESTIHVLPNSIFKPIWKYKEVDTRKKKFRDKKLYKHPPKKIKVGFVGGASHDEDILIIYRAIKEVLNKRKDVEFIVRSGGVYPEWYEPIDGLDFKLVSTHISKYAQMLYDLHLDIALAPLRDTDFNRCKTNLKWIEWSSLKVPVIASRVEPFLNTNGEIKLVSNDVDEWVKAINESISLKKVNKNWGQNAYKDCFKNYNIYSNVYHLLKYIEKMFYNKNN